MYAALLKCNIGFARPSSGSSFQLKIVKVKDRMLKGMLFQLS